MNILRTKLEDLCYRSPYFIRWLAVNGYGQMLAWRRFGDQFKQFRELFEESQAWDPVRIREYQLSKLRKLLKRVSVEVPYYRRLFQEHNLKAGDFHTLSDLKKLPKLTKRDIRTNSSTLLNENIGKMEVIRASSSGTTGEKVEFYLPRQLAYNVNYALLWRSYSWAGVHLGDKRVTIGGRWFTHKPPYWIYNMAESQLLLSVHHLNDKTVDEYIQKISEFRPVFIQGQPNGIYAVASRMVETGRKIAVKAVFSTGETLEEGQRAIIEDVFEAKVFETYGLGECVVSAQECEYHVGFHELSELGIIEIEKDEPTGLYRVIGTSLWNDAMPFIRYEIEDLIECSPTEICHCKRGLSLKIRCITGRIDDIVRAADGTTILPVTIRMIIKAHLRTYETYQFQQIGKRDYALAFVGDLEETRRKVVEPALKERLGALARIDFKTVDNIMTSAGKIRNVVNLYKTGSRPDLHVNTSAEDSPTTRI